MIGGKSIALFACAWGQPLQDTIKIFDLCQKIFPYFDELHFEKNIDNMTDYNRFMIESLNSVINADFVLTVQSDGYIINPNLWQDKFLDYDYIGAPWYWHGVCGNGGFSLRSKKFLHLSSKLEYSKNLQDRKVPEDSFLCLSEYNRKYFTDNGIKFADVETAIKFSFEHPMPQFINHKKNNSFGFHGKFNL